MSGTEVSVDATTLADEHKQTQKDELKRSLSKHLKFKEEEEEEEEDHTGSKKVVKRRKKCDEEKQPMTISTEVFLQIFYPLTKYMGKYVTVGLVKSMEYSPNVILNHGAKILTFNEHAWDSFTKHLHLIECYLANNLMGKKSNIRLLDCDIEIDIIKQRGEQQVRFKDLTKYEDKVLLTQEEFYKLSCVTPAVTRYLKQLVFSHSVLREYLLEAIDTQPDSQILHGPIDTSIFNRIPHEVEMWRLIKEYEEKINEEETQPNNVVQKEEEETSNVAQKEEPKE